MTPSAMRGTMLMKSMLPARTDETSTPRQRRRHRIGGEGTARQDRAERRSDQKSLQARVRPQRPRDFVVRQNFRNEAAEQAAGQHARYDFAEQPEIMGEDLEHAIDAVAPP